MTKENTIKMSGKVVDVLPNAMFRVEVDNPPTKILAHIAGKIRKNNINILLGDRVDLELSLYDLSKGRIVYRHK